MYNKVLTRCFFMSLVISISTSCASPKYDEFTEHKKSLVKNVENTSTIMISLKPGNIEFRGMYENDNSINSANFLYHGGAGAGGVLAQIITQAAINSSLKNDKINKQREAAKKTLQPIESILNKMTSDILIQNNAGFSYIAIDGSDTSQGVTFSSNPIFFFNKRRNAVTLKHKVTATRGSNPKVLYQNLIEVISPTFNTLEGSDAHADEKTNQLTKTLKNIYQDSLALAKKDFQGELVSSSPQHSHRIRENHKLRVERGYLIEADTSGRAVIRNLRGWLISYPTENSNHINEPPKSKNEAQDPEHNSVPTADRNHRSPQEIRS